MPGECSKSLTKGSSPFSPLRMPRNISGGYLVAQFELLELRSKHTRHERVPAANETNADVPRQLRFLRQGNHLTRAFQYVRYLRKQRTRERQNRKEKNEAEG